MPAVPLTHLSQAGKGVDPPAVAVAPLDLDRVAPDPLDLHGVDVERHRRGIEATLPGPLVDALCTGAGEPQIANVVSALVAVGPDDDELAGPLLPDLSEV